MLLNVAPGTQLRGCLGCGNNCSHAYAYRWVLNNPLHSPLSVQLLSCLVLRGRNDPMDDAPPEQEDDAPDMQHQVRGLGTAARQALIQHHFT